MIRLLTILTILFCLTSNVVWSADFFKGMDAYDKGDYASALSEWTPLAEQGDAVAQNNLGLMYDRGHGVQQDYEIALKWSRLSAEQGYANAQW